MAAFLVIDEKTRCLKLTREEAVEVVRGLVDLLAEIGPQGMPEVNTGLGYRIAFTVENRNDSKVKGGQ